MSVENKTLTVVQETEILGKKIVMYGSIEKPYFVASDVAKWLGERDGYTVARKVSEEEKDTQIVCTPGGDQRATVLTEDGLYEACMLSRKEIAKPLKKEIKKYLKSIRLTGAAIPVGNEEKMVSYYFSGLSDELQGQIVNELIQKNKELQSFYDTLMNTEGLMSMNTVSKELGGIGLKTLFKYLREKEIMFYKDDVNIPYQRFMKQKLFAVKESICSDGKSRSVTYATKKGLDYIRKLLTDDGYDFEKNVFMTN